MPPRTITLSDVWVHKDTGKAVLISFDEDDSVQPKWWVPHSLIVDWDEMEEGECGDMILPEWFVEQEEIDEDA